MLAGIGATIATGGTAAPAIGAAGGTGAAGAGAAAGLLGSTAAANAAGYGAGAALGGAGTGLGVGAAGDIGATGIMGLDNAMALNTSDVLGAGQGFMGDGLSIGKTIGSDLVANPYTGGFDSLNGIERVGQRIGGFLDDGGMDTLGKVKGAFGGQQEQPQEAQNTEVSGGAVAQQEQPQGQMPNVYGQPAIQLTDEQKRRFLAQGLL